MVKWINVLKETPVPVGVRCMVCLDGLPIPATLLQLGCGHGAQLIADGATLHVGCLSDWLLSEIEGGRAADCPLCRTLVPGDDIDTINADIEGFFNAGADVGLFLAPPSDTSGDTNSITSGEEAAEWNTIDQGDIEGAAVHKYLSLLRAVGRTDLKMSNSDPKE